MKKLLSKFILVALLILISYTASSLCYIIIITYITYAVKHLQLIKRGILHLNH